MDRVTKAYLAECLSPGSRLRSVMGSVRLADNFRENYRDRLLARPLFAERAVMEAVSADLVRLYRILVDLPDRLFDGDVARYCAHLGMDPVEAALLRPVGPGRPALYGRADLYRVDTEFRLLEFNIGSRAGGIDYGQLGNALLAVEPFREFAEEHRLDHVNASAELARSITDQAAAIGRGDNPVVALVEADGGLGAYPAGYGSVADGLRAFGVDLRLGELGELRTVGGDLVLDGVRIDVVLRFFSVGQIRGDRGAMNALHALLRAHERGRVVFFTPLESYLPSNKGALALLSDPEWRTAFTVDETELIDRCLPWTRLLRAGAGSRDLVDACRAAREDLILKPGNGFGGGGILAGWELTDREWRDALMSSRGAGFTVQKRVIPTPDEVVDPATGEIGAWRATWGPFVTERGYAGTMVRAVPVDAGAVVSFGGSTATRITGVYTSG